MIQLVQFPWSPYCLVQKRILEFGAVPHELIDVPPSDRSLIWRWTRQRYYQVPILKHGRNVLFETDDNSQVLAKYVDKTFGLGLFPEHWDGLQRILWRYIDNEVEGIGFRLNDAHYREFVPRNEQLAYVRHKERRFGRGCLDQWNKNQGSLLAELSGFLVPFEQMLAGRLYLLDDRPRFVDFNLCGILSNFLYSGHYSIPSVHPKLRLWHKRMSRARLADIKT